MLPAYRESLHARYPPVCETCLPQVEEEIRRKEQMARVQALGGWLTKGKERQRRVSSEASREKLASDTLFWWKARGCLWALCMVLAVGGDVSGMWALTPFIFYTLANWKQVLWVMRHSRISPSYILSFLYLL